MTLGPRTIEPAAAGDALDRLQPRLHAGQQAADRAAAVVGRACSPRSPARPRWRRSPPAPGSAPNRSAIRLWVSSRTFSAPQTMNFRPDRSSGSAARAYWLTKVSVASRIEASVSFTSGGICLMCSGEGYWNAFMPGQHRQQHAAGQAEAVEGRQRVEQHPGRVERRCGRRPGATLATRLAWVSTTPARRAEAAGGEQDHAGIVGPGRRRGTARDRRRRQRRSSLSARPIAGAHVLQVGDRRRASPARRSGRAACPARRSGGRSAPA